MSLPSAARPGPTAVRFVPTRTSRTPFPTNAAAASVPTQAPTVPALTESAMIFVPEPEPPREICAHMIDKLVDAIHLVIDVPVMVFLLVTALAFFINSPTLHFNEKRPLTLAKMPVNANTVLDLPDSFFTPSEAIWRMALVTDCDTGAVITRQALLDSKDASNHRLVLFRLEVVGIEKTDTDTEPATITIFEPSEFLGTGNGQESKEQPFPTQLPTIIVANVDADVVAGLSDDSEHVVMPLPTVVVTDSAAAVPASHIAEASVTPSPTTFPTAEPATHAAAGIATNHIDVPVNQAVTPRTVAVTPTAGPPPLSAPQTLATKVSMAWYKRENASSSAILGQCRVDAGRYPVLDEMEWTQLIRLKDEGLKAAGVNDLRIRRHMLRVLWSVRRSLFQRHPVGCELPPPPETPPFVELLEDAHAWMQASGISGGPRALFPADIKWDELRKVTKEGLEGMGMKPGAINRLLKCIADVEEEIERRKGTVLYTSPVASTSLSANAA
ncbi:hypothetical protein BOTBODRAFT_180875 [Botryobasidium botryosum FD-172 SS1]|uniref:SAM domain-containing protein n=1 Tax=Botryobasidium botryosum (strain FD-172 SS1) TaxID=930990 RepID=A0A067M6I5_BOTB1|nr:hypothetical protein BOTBODRAFT_180875 [Botryobasidium botryosum FD-172 SS1]